MKTVALICDMNYYDCAIKGFDRLCIAEYREKSAKPALKATLCLIRKKSLLSKFRRIEQINRVALNSGFFIAALRALSSRNHTGADKCGRFTDKPSGKNCWCTRIHKQADKVTLAFSSRYERLIIRICTSIIKMG